MAGRHRKLTANQEWEICFAYKAGETGAEIVARFPICHKTVFNILERHGIERRSAGSKRGAKRKPRKRTRDDRGAIVPRRGTQKKTPRKQETDWYKHGDDIEVIAVV